MPFVEPHHLTFQQYDAAQLHIGRIRRDVPGEEGLPVPNWQPYSPDVSPVEHLWDALNSRVPQQVLVPQKGSAGGCRPCVEGIALCVRLMVDELFKFFNLDPQRQLCSSLYYSKIIVLRLMVMFILLSIYTYFVTEPLIQVFFSMRLYFS